MEPMGHRIALHPASERPVETASAETGASSVATMTSRDHFAGDPRTNRERMLAGDFYIADDPENAALEERARRLSHAYGRAVEEGSDDARSLLSQLIAGLGDDVIIRPPFFVEYGDRMSIGDRTFANFNFTALDVAPITIGADCQLGPSVQLLTPTHPIDPRLRRAKLEAAEPITIGDNVWLGGGVIVCPGVTIGDDTVVGAGAVVSPDLPAGVVAVGNPARVIRTVDAD
jgi:maltose O-acetyltransferase